MLKLKLDSLQHTVSLERGENCIGEVFCLPNWLRVCIHSFLELFLEICIVVCDWLVCDSFVCVCVRTCVCM